MPPWERRALPLVYCGETLAAVAGIGVDVALRRRGAGSRSPAITAPSLGIRVPGESSAARDSPH